MSTFGSCFIQSIAPPMRVGSPHAGFSSLCSQRPRCRTTVSNCIRGSHPQSLESQDSFIPLSGGAPHQHSRPDSPWIQESPSPDPTAVSASYDGNINGGSNINNNNNNNSGGGSGENSDSSDESLPDDMKTALAYGSLTREAINRFKTARMNPFLGFLLSIPSFRSRFLMDSSFLFKLLVQEIIGNGTALAGEIAVRGSDIVHELEYVASDLIVGTVIEAAFVWLLAPTLVLPAAPNASALSKYFSSLPAHIFQPSSAMQSFSVSQRVVCFFNTAMQYAGIGFVGGIVGTAITYGLLESRKLLDKDYKPFRPLPAVLPNSLGWAAFMAGSCNTRFQFVEGLEMGVAKLLAGRYDGLVNPSIITLRFINNYIGGVQFVEFFRAIGLHATGDEHDNEKGVSKENSHEK